MLSWVLTVCRSSACSRVFLSDWSCLSCSGLARPPTWSGCAARDSPAHAHCSCSLFMLQTLQEEKERKSECLPPEPHPDDPESVKIIFKLPNDSRVERRFHFTQSLTVSLGQS